MNAVRLKAFDMGTSSEDVIWTTQDAGPDGGAREVPWRGRAPAGRIGCRPAPKCGAAGHNSRGCCGLAVYGAGAGARLSEAATARTAARGLTRNSCTASLFLSPCTTIGLPAIMAR